MRTPLAILALVAALALAACDPVSTTAPATGHGGSGATSAASSLAPSGASTAATSGASVVSVTPPPVAAPPDPRVRELEAALAAQGEKNEKDLSGLRAELAATVAKLEDENRKLREDLEAEQARMRAELDRTAKMVDALRAASPIPNLAYDVPKIDGRVLALQRTELGPVVVLDVGRKQGVEPRFEFTITRGQRPVGKIAVDRVESEISSGRVVYAKDGETIREGDTATTRP